MTPPSPHHSAGRVFLAGATGVIGQALVPLLQEAGWVVVGMTRSPAKAELLMGEGVEPVVCDVFDLAALTEALVSAEPSMVMHQLTDLPDDADDLPAYSEMNDRIRTEGTRNLLAAARAAGVERLLGQSIAWPLPNARQAVIDRHEQALLGAGAVVLRYGRFYGPGTYYDEDAVPEPPRITVAEAASRTVELLDAPAGVVTVAE